MEIVLYGGADRRKEVEACIIYPMKEDHTTDVAREAEKISIEEAPTQPIADAQRVNPRFYREKKDASFFTQAWADKCYSVSKFQFKFK